VVVNMFIVQLEISRCENIGTNIPKFEHAFFVQPCSGTALKAATIQYWVTAKRFEARPKLRFGSNDFH